MRTHKTIHREYDEKVIDKMTCCLCGAECPHPAFRSGAANWDGGPHGGHDYEETTVEIKVGSRYPEGGYEKSAFYDVCPACFHTKLMPWFASQGAKPETKETDY